MLYPSHSSPRSRHPFHQTRRSIMRNGAIVMTSVALGAEIVLALLSVDLGTSCSGAVLKLVMWAVIAIAIAVMVVRGLVGAWELLGCLSRSRGRGRRSSVYGMLSVACIIVLVGNSLLEVPARSFVWRHQAELMSLMAGDSGKLGRAYDVIRFAQQTVIVYPMVDDIFDSYWFIYDHTIGDSLSDSLHGAWRGEKRSSESFWSFIDRSRDRVHHLWGPWFVMVR